MRRYAQRHDLSETYCHSVVSERWMLRSRAWGCSIAISEHDDVHWAAPSDDSPACSPSKGFDFESAWVDPETMRGV